MAALQRLLRRSCRATSVAAILIEPVQGEGGYQPAPLEFLRQLRAFCDEHGILLIADEVQTGYARTGRCGPSSTPGSCPTSVCLAKAIANGLPLSAIATRRELQDRWGKERPRVDLRRQPGGVRGRHRRPRDDQARGPRRERGRPRRQLTPGLERFMAEDARIGDVRGPGLMIGVEFVTDRATREPDGDLADAMVAQCAEDGLLLLSRGLAHQVVRWIAPIDVTAAEIDEALEIFWGALRQGLSRTRPRSDAGTPDSDKRPP